MEKTLPRAVAQEIILLNQIEVNGAEDENRWEDLTIGQNQYRTQMGT